MINITRTTYNKIEEYSRAMKGKEIGGLLIGKIVEDNSTKGLHNIIVTNAIILKQKKTSTSFDIDDDAMMEFTKNASDKTLSSIIGWWHTHGYGGLFWSIVDDECSKRIVNMSGFNIGIVTTVPFWRPMNVLCRIEVRDQKGRIISTDDAAIYIDDEDNSTTTKVSKKEIIEDIEQNVREDKEEEVTEEYLKEMSELDEYLNNDGENDKESRLQKTIITD